MQPNKTSYAPFDAELEKVFAELMAVDPSGTRWAGVVRHTYDLLYNGQETGRYRWDQLFKTEKTHFGTLVEIHAQREFGFYDGEIMDYSISGIEVDMKWSQTEGGWMLPPESFGHLVLVATGSDSQSTFSLGLVRLSTQNMRGSSNRDGKTSLSLEGRAAIRWLWKKHAMPSNILLQLTPEIVDHIFDSSSGQERLLRLLRASSGQVIRRVTIATVARQLDPMKRLRGNGGARSLLGAEGFLVLSGKYHSRIAEEFGVVAPSNDEVLALRVVPTEEKGVLLDGRKWRLAIAADIEEYPAPSLIGKNALTDES